MNPRMTTTVATYGLLTIAGGVMLTLPESMPTAGAMPLADPGDKVRITGSVRDFLSTHPDFNVTPSAGNGHYAGNMSRALAADNRPAFLGAGYRVASQWLQGDGYPMPPHLAMPPDGLFLGDGMFQDKDTVLDTWDSTKGPYDPILNSGPIPSLQIGWTMPSVSPPTGMGASVGDVNYKNTVNLNADIHCDDFTTEKDTIVNIAGHITIWCEDSFDMGRDSIVNILPNSSLTLYVGELFRVAQRGQVNMNTMEPSRLWVYNLGTTQMEINQASHVCGIIISPDAPLHLAQDDHFYGKFMGKSIQQDQTTGMHVDTTPWPNPCGGSFDDTMGVPSAMSAGGITSSATFDDWFHDTLGVNLSNHHTITLTENGSGVYEYLDDSFYPIDHRMYGNEGLSHNNYFTYHFQVEFVHNACANSFFSFEGNDDAWMFVDDQLAMDLGGVMPGTSQYVELDRLGLVDGETYTIRFFYAHRTPGSAVFRLRTNAALVKDSGDMVVSGGFD